MNLSKIEKALDLLGEAREVLDELHAETERAISASVSEDLKNWSVGVVLKDKWMDIAKAELGTKEINGRGHNPRILEYLATTSLGSWGASRDETPWCSAFVNWVLEQAGVEGTDNAMARSWLKWGRGIEDPIMGCIVVLKRGTGSSGHVGFFADWTTHGISLIGGNQSDSVCYKSYKRSDVLGYRLPND